MELITYAYLREQTAISKNIPDDELRVPLARATDILSGMLGTQFFNQIQAHADAVTLAGNNLSLFDPYIKKFLAWQSYLFWLPYSNFKSTRSGMRVHNTENSQPATDQQVGAMVSDLRNQVQFYKEAIFSHIRKVRFSDSSAYPLFEDCVPNNLGTGFAITGASKESNIFKRIDKRIDYNG